MGGTDQWVDRIRSTSRPARHSRHASSPTLRGVSPPRKGRYTALGPTRRGARRSLGTPRSRQPARGLPKGKGTVAEGADVYARRCTEGHGDEGQGGDAEPLVGGKGTLRSPRPLKTVGSYWPYATTVWDYVDRAMPFDRPGMLTVNQVYAVVAYLLAMNGIIDEAHGLSDSTLPDVRMPNRDSFVPASETDLRTEPSRAVDGK